MHTFVIQMIIPVAIVVAPVTAPKGRVVGGSSEGANRWEPPDSQDGMILLLQPWTKTQLRGDAVVVLRDHDQVVQQPPGERIFFML